MLRFPALCSARVPGAFTWMLTVARTGGWGTGSSVSSLSNTRISNSAISNNNQSKHPQRREFGNLAKKKRLAMINVERKAKLNTKYLSGERMADPARFEAAKKVLRRHRYDKGYFDEDIDREFLDENSDLPTDKEAPPVDRAEPAEAKMLKQLGYKDPPATSEKYIKALELYRKLMRVDEHSDPTLRYPGVNREFIDIVKSMNPFDILLDVNRSVPHQFDAHVEEVVSGMKSHAEKHFDGDFYKTLSNGLCPVQFACQNLTLMTLIGGFNGIFVTLRHMSERQQTVDYPTYLRLLLVAGCYERFTDMMSYFKRMIKEKQVTRSLEFNILLRAILGQSASIYPRVISKQKLEEYRALYEYDSRANYPSPDFVAEYFAKNPYISEDPDNMDRSYWPVQYAELTPSVAESHFDSHPIPFAPFARPSNSEGHFEDMFLFVVSKMMELQIVPDEYTIKLIKGVTIDLPAGIAFRLPSTHKLWLMQFTNAFSDDDPEIALINTKHPQGLQGLRDEIHQVMYNEYAKRKLFTSSSKTNKTRRVHE